ncbi:hypothetical protein GVAV_001544 [Gurleya vavrai]
MFNYECKLINYKTLIVIACCLINLCRSTSQEEEIGTNIKSDENPKNLKKTSIEILEESNINLRSNENSEAESSNTSKDINITRLSTDLKKSPSVSNDYISKETFLEDTENNSSESSSEYSSRSSYESSSDSYIFNSSEKSDENLDEYYSEDLNPIEEEKTEEDKEIINEDSQELPINNIDKNKQEFLRGKGETFDHTLEYLIDNEQVLKKLKLNDDIDPITEKTLSMLKKKGFIITLELKNLVRLILHNNFKLVHSDDVENNNISFCEIQKGIKDNEEKNSPKSLANSDEKEIDLCEQKQEKINLLKTAEIISQQQ